MEQLGNRHSENCRESVSSTFRVFAEHNEFILAVIRSRCRYELDVEDVYQDLFLYLVNKPVPRDVTSIRSYLYGAIVMRTGDASRRVRRYRSSLYTYGEEKEVHRTFDTPDKTALLKEEAGRAIRLIEKGYLKRSEARAIKLRYISSRDPKDVASEMGVDVRSVSRYISVGLKRIRLLMKA